MKYMIKDSGKEYTFSQKGKKRVEIDEEFVLVNADIKLADGTMMDAVLLIDEFSSGEHWGTYFMLSDRLVSQDASGFEELLGKTKDQIFPYKYKIRAKLMCEDIHCGKDGWS